ncbi:MAG: cysteine desulfurase [Oscillospiraceae bacterium]|jgi:cysteine desulfurase|nr:cysteine desulfurase [Oscillospiraceae bacterium]
MIYADNAATTRLSEAAFVAMMPFLREDYGNPSATHAMGRAAKTAVEAARREIADAIGARNNEIYFTSGGTEADNLAVFAALAAPKKRGKHIISTTIEHSAILRTLEKYAAEGYEVTLLKPESDGIIAVEALEKALRDDTVFVSVMAANNVVGTIQPIAELCAAAKKRGAVFHTDAVQACGHIPLNVRTLGVDLLSISAHKFNGPKGTGALYARLPQKIPPLLTGGGQEKGARSGTENVAGIVGMAAALRESVAEMPEVSARVAELRDYLIAGVLEITGSRLTGDSVRRLPGSASFVFEGLAGQDLVWFLDEAGVAASSGSACMAGSDLPSHVLSALGFDERLAKSALRLTLGRYNTREDADGILRALPGCVLKARQLGKTRL